MKLNRPHTTLFILQTVDGKISTGVDPRDFDTDLPEINSISKGLHQYYELEKKGNKVSLNTGKVMKKIGVNTKTTIPTKTDIDFVILDNKPHLTQNGVEYICNWVNKLYLFTKNRNHPAYSLKVNNLEIINFESLHALFETLYSKYNIREVTIQSGGTLNSELLQNKLIDEISLVIAPILVGGRDTPSLIGGNSLKSIEDLKKITTLNLKEVTKLHNSYLHLKYIVNK